MKAAREHFPNGTDVAGARLEAPPGTLPPWYALYVMPNAEFVVEDALRADGIETFLPTWLDVTQWSDRKKTIRRPLFPGYLFAHGARQEVLKVLMLAGVIKILPDNLKPAPVDASEIENVRRALASGLALKPCEYVTGDQVVIDSGPLAGVKGIVQRSKNGTRVVVKIEMLRRAVSVEIDVKDLMKDAA